MSNRAAQDFPYVDRFLQGYGWIEIGNDGMSGSWLRVLDDGGMVREGTERYATLDDALRAADRAIAEWVQTVLGERWFASHATRRRRSPARASGADPA